MYLHLQSTSCSARPSSSHRCWRYIHLYVYRSIHLPTYLCISPSLAEKLLSETVLLASDSDISTDLSTFLPVYLPIYLPIYLNKPLSITEKLLRENFLFSQAPAIYPPTCLTIYLPSYPPIYIYICIYVQIYIYVYIYREREI